MSNHFVESCYITKRCFTPFQYSSPVVQSTDSRQPPSTNLQTPVTLSFQSSWAAVGTFLHAKFLGLTKYSLNRCWNCWHSMEVLIIGNWLQKHHAGMMTKYIVFQLSNYNYSCNYFVINCLHLQITISTSLLYSRCRLFQGKSLHCCTSTSGWCSIVFIESCTSRLKLLM